VVNNTDYETSWVFIEFNLYDDSGLLVDNTCDAVENLEPHTRWNFEALVSEGRAAKAKLKKMYGYYQDK
jgi:hypothetical protein